MNALPLKTLSKYFHVIISMTVRRMMELVYNRIKRVQLLVAQRVEELQESTSVVGCCGRDTTYKGREYERSIVVFEEKWLCELFCREGKVFFSVTEENEGTSGT